MSIASVAVLRKKVISCSINGGGSQLRVYYFVHLWVCFRVVFVSEDFVVANDLETLVAGMNKITPDHPLDLEHIRSQIVARDTQIKNKFSKDAQVTAIRGARNYLGDKLIRTARPHKILDPANGPLIAVRLHILTRKTLGGLQTNLQSQVLDEDGEIIPGLFAAGEAAGFGGGGYHGYNALEGTFLGGCIFSGRNGGRSDSIA